MNNNNLKDFFRTRMERLYELLDKDYTTRETDDIMDILDDAIVGIRDLDTCGENE